MRCKAGLEGGDKKHSQCSFLEIMNLKIKKVYNSIFFCDYIGKNYLIHLFIYEQ